MGMLECLRAPNTDLGVPAAGAFPLSPSCRGVSLSSSRLNCELFMVLRMGGLMPRLLGGKVPPSTIRA
jgi:hypothetical protein